MYKNLIENDINPFMIFDNSGRLKEFNKKAEFLFNEISPKKLYSLAIQYAPHSFGFSQKFIHLTYGKINYYAILVGYIDENQIAIKLYKESCRELELIKIKNIKLTNLFSLIEISKSTTLSRNIKLEEVSDVSIPEIKIDINQFLLTLNNCFSLFQNAKYLKIKVSIEIGEYELIKNKKYQIISIEFIGDNMISIDNKLELQALNAHINIFLLEKGIKLKFPMIL